MGAFSAFPLAAEPLVGEVFGLRTFRVDDSGLLLPLFSDGLWYDGPNTATCAPPTGPYRGPAHQAPAEDCECGFYAYGNARAAGSNKHTRYVQAVVACWGSVIAGTQGVRAQHARIVGIWLNPAAPAWLRTRVAVRYPSARLYDDTEAMLTAHPLSELQCYEPSPARRLAPMVGYGIGGARVRALGVLPLGTLRGVEPLWYLWLACTVAAAVLTGWLAFGARSTGHVAAALIVGGVLAWLVAPWFGLLGWVLRLPLLRGFAVWAGGRLLALRPQHFPIVAAPREQTFRGVRY